MKRCSSKQSGSSRVSAKSSANAVTASLNATPCFSKFALALARFHSTRIFELYIYLCIFASTESLLFIASLFLPADAGIQPTINHPTVPKIKPRMADRVVNAIYPQRRTRRLQAPIGSRRRTRSTSMEPLQAPAAHRAPPRTALNRVENGLPPGQKFRYLAPQRYRDKAMQTHEPRRGGIRWISVSCPSALQGQGHANA